MHSFLLGQIAPSIVDCTALQSLYLVNEYHKSKGIAPILPSSTAKSSEKGIEPLDWLLGAVVSCTTCMGIGLLRIINLQTRSGGQVVTCTGCFRQLCKWMPPAVAQTLLSPLHNLQIPRNGNLTSRRSRNPEEDYIRT